MLSLILIFSRSPSSASRIEDSSQLVTLNSATLATASSITLAQLPWRDSSRHGTANSAPIGTKFKSKTRRSLKSAMSPTFWRRPLRSRTPKKRRNRERRISQTKSRSSSASTSVVQCKWKIAWNFASEPYRAKFRLWQLATLIARLVSLPLTTRSRSLVTALRSP